MPVRTNRARVFVDGFDFSAETTGVTVAGSVSSLDVTNLMSSGIETIPSATSFTIDQNGYLADPNGLELAMNVGLENASSVAVLLGIDGADAGVAYVMNGTNTSAMTIEAPVEGLITLSGSWAPAECYRGTLITYGTFDAGSPYLLTLPDAAVGRVDGTLVWQITTPVGPVDLDVLVEHDDDSGYGSTDVLGGLNITDRFGVHVMGGPLQKYIRVAVSGTNSDAVGFLSFSY